MITVAAGHPGTAGTEVETRVSSDEPRHQALPTLYGAPAYVRPRQAPAGPVARPFDPDELPLAAAMTDEEREAVEHLPAQVWHPGGAVIDGAAEPAPTDRIPARGFSLRSIAGRLLGGE